jgi:ABC-type transporter Mla maintaining outer membrane lipid asymmetry ATPase subunit MlaF
MMPDDIESVAVVMKGVEKHYGALRPLRVNDLRVSARETTMLIGLDRPAAEILVSLITGAALPDRGEVVSLGRQTRDIVDSDEWLSFVDRFGIVSDRIVLLEAMTVAQNLAISFDLELDPIPGDVRALVASLADEAEIDPPLLEMRVAEATAPLRSRVYLARALALNPEVLILEHPTAGLTREDGIAYAAVVKRISGTRRLTLLGLSMDEQFAKATGGRLLFWRPATGEIRSRSRFALWRGDATSGR